MALAVSLESDAGQGDKDYQEHAAKNDPETPASFNRPPDSAWIAAEVRGDLSITLELASRAVVARLEPRTLLRPPDAGRLNARINEWLLSLTGRWHVVDSPVLTVGVIV
jgi:hypothetical protein